MQSEDVCDTQLYMFSDTSPVVLKSWRVAHPAVICCDAVLMKYRRMQFDKLVKSKLAVCKRKMKCETKVRSILIQTFAKKY